MLMTKRKERRARKQKRIKVLKDIDKMTEKCCVNCCGFKGNDSNTIEVAQCQCDAAIKIRSLGDKLSELVAARDWELKFIEVKKKKGISVADYLFFISSGITDVQVTNTLGIPKSNFQTWKNTIGLNRSVLKSEKDVEEIIKNHGNETYYY